MGILQEGTAILDVAKVVTNSEYESRGITKGLILSALFADIFSMYSALAIRPYPITGRN